MPLDFPHCALSLLDEKKSKKIFACAARLARQLGENTGWHSLDLVKPWHQFCDKYDLPIHANFHFKTDLLFFKWET